METETPLIAETIALTEKKVAMALDDIIKLSKRNTNMNKGRKPRRGKTKNQTFNTSKVRHYVSSLSAVRQGAVAKRRSNIQGNKFSVATNIARKATTTAPPLSVRGGRAFNAGRMTTSNQSRIIAPPVQNRFTVKRHEKVEKRKTLDSRFAIMKEQRKQSCNNYGAGVQFPPRATVKRFTY